MTAPIPLAAPDGTVCAWACGEYADARAWIASEATSTVYERRRDVTMLSDPSPRRDRDESVAALCGVDVETVRGWRSA